MKNKRVLIIVAAIIICAAGVGILIFSGGNAVAQVSRQLDLGNKYFSEGNYEEAIVAYEKIIQIDPKNTDARIGLAKVYIETGNDDKATQYITEALEIDDKKSEIYITYADILLETGDAEKAAQILQQGYDLTKDPALLSKYQEIENLIAPAHDDQPSEPPVISEPQGNEPAEPVEEVITLTGIIIDNSKEYSDKTNEIYAEGGTVNSFGFKLESSNDVVLEGKTYSVSAMNVYNGNDEEINKNMSTYVGKSVTVTGRLLYNGEEPQVTHMVDNETGEAKDVTGYMLNGPVGIKIDSISVLEEATSEPAQNQTPEPTPTPKPAPTPEPTPEPSPSETSEPIEITEIAPGITVSISSEEELNSLRSSSSRGDLMIGGIHVDIDLSKFESETVRNNTYGVHTLFDIRLPSDQEINDNFNINKEYLRVESKQQRLGIVHPFEAEGSYYVTLVFYDQQKNILGIYQSQQAFYVGKQQ